MDDMDTFMDPFYNNKLQLIDSGIALGLTPEEAKRRTNETDSDTASQSSSEANANEYVFIATHPVFHRTESEQLEESRRRMKQVDALDRKEQVTREKNLKRWHEEEVGLAQDSVNALDNLMDELDISNAINTINAENEASRQQLEEADRQIEEEFEAMDAFNKMIEKARAADD